MRAVLERAHRAGLETREWATLGALFALLTSYQRTSDQLFIGQVAARAYAVETAAPWQIKRTGAALAGLKAKNVLVGYVPGRGGRRSFIDLGKVPDSATFPDSKGSSLSDLSSEGKDAERGRERSPSGDAKGSPHGAPSVVDLRISSPYRARELVDTRPVVIGAIETESEKQYVACLAARMGEVLSKGGKRVDADDVLDFLWWAASQITLVLVDEAIGYCATLDVPPRKVEFFARTVTNWAFERQGIRMTPFRPTEDDVDAAAV